MQPKLILFETTSRWAMAIRRATLGLHLPLVETRSLRACGEELSRRPHSIVALETTAENLPVIIELADRWRRESLGLRLLALADREVLVAEDLLLDAGMSYVVESPLKLTPLLRIVERHLRPRPRAVEQSIEQAVQQALPWSRAGEAGFSS